MFNFIDMMDNYEDRKVGRFDEGSLMVSTAQVSDGSHPYETAVQHPEYNDGSMVIVEAYDTRLEAQEGHDRWIKTMTTGELPAELKDCCNSGVSQMADAFGAESSYPRKPAK